MSKALIEKAFEQFMEKELGFIPNPQDSFYHLHKKLWLECATWQREQLIQELREAREIIESCAKAYVLNDIGHLRGEQAGQFLAKLDLLEG